MNPRIPTLAVAVLLSACAAAPLTPAARDAGTAAVNAALDAWHLAASRSDEDGYFRRFAPEAVFLGTDASERWALPAFRAFAHPYFSQGKGWTFVPRHRNVVLSDDGQVAWFDEALDSASYGECRGSGVLRRLSGEWRIAQYNLTIPIPNALAKQVVRLIRDSPPAFSPASRRGSH